MPRLPMLFRQNKVFELVTQGRTHAEICKQLNISEDTIARDMQAISDQVKEIMASRLGEVIAQALVTYQAVIDNAWREYRTAAEREKRWYKGEMDYTHESVVTKTLATESTNEDDEADDDGIAFTAESAPLEVKRTRRSVRPALVGSDRRAWLTLIIEATREYTELLGIKKLAVEITGKDGGPIEFSLEDWKKHSAERLAAAEATLSLLDEAPDA